MYFGALVLKKVKIIIVVKDCLSSPGIDQATKQAIEDHDSIS